MAERNRNARDGQDAGASEAVRLSGEQSEVTLKSYLRREDPNGPRIVRLLNDPRRSDGASDGDPPLTAADARDLAEAGLAALTEAWSNCQLGRFQQAYARIDRLEELLAALHARAVRGVEDEHRLAAYLQRGPAADLPPFVVNAKAVPHIEAICRRWLPNGGRRGAIWWAPHHPFGLSVSLMTGAWYDHAGHYAGEDVISLAEFLFDLTRCEAVEKVAKMLGLRGDR